MNLCQLIHHMPWFPKTMVTAASIRISTWLHACIAWWLHVKTKHIILFYGKMCTFISSEKKHLLRVHIWPRWVLLLEFFYIDDSCFVETNILYLHLHINWFIYALLIMNKLTTPSCHKRNKIFATLRQQSHVKHITRFKGKRDYKLIENLQKTGGYLN